MLIYVSKISVVRCLSNAIIKVPRNLLRKNFEIAVIKYFWNGTFEKEFIITATEVVLIYLLSRKNENENTKYHGFFHII